MSAEVGSGGGGNRVSRRRPSPAGTKGGFRRAESPYDRSKEGKVHKVPLVKVNKSENKR